MRVHQEEQYLTSNQLRDMSYRDAVSLYDSRGWQLLSEPRNRAAHAVYACPSGKSVVRLASHDPAFEAYAIECKQHHAKNPYFPAVLKQCRLARGGHASLVERLRPLYMNDADFPREFEDIYLFARGFHIESPQTLFRLSSDAALISAMRVIYSKALKLNADNPFISPLMDGGNIAGRPKPDGGFQYVFMDPLYASKGPVMKPEQFPQLANALARCGVTSDIQFRAAATYEGQPKTNWQVYHPPYHGFPI